MSLRTQLSQDWIPDPETVKIISVGGFKNLLWVTHCKIRGNEYNLFSSLARQLDL